MRSSTTRRMAVAAAAVTVALVGALTGCSSSGSGDGSVSGGDYKGPNVTINFWHGWTGGAAPTIVPKLVSQFNKEHPNIKVVETPIEWGDIAKKMPLAVKSGKGPDVSVTHGDSVATYAAQGLLLDADKIVDQLGYKPSDFPAGVMDSGKYKGKQYAIPWSVTPLGMYVNKDVLTKAGLDPNTIPTDKATYTKYLDTLKASGVQGEWVDGFVFTGQFEFQSLLWQFGGDLFNKDNTKATFNDEAGVKALTWMTDLVKNGYSPADVAQNGNINALVAGQTAFNWNGVWITSYDPLQKTNWTAAPVPQIGDQKAVWSSSTHWIFLNNKGQDKNKTAASATFVQWMNDHSIDWAQVGELPAKNSVRDDPKLLQQYPQLKPFLGELDYAHYEVPAPGIVDAEAPIQVAISEALHGTKTPQQALDDAADKANNILQQNKEQYQ